MQTLAQHERSVIRDRRQCDLDHRIVDPTNRLNHDSADGETDDGAAACNQQELIGETGAGGGGSAHVCEDQR